MQPNFEAMTNKELLAYEERTSLLMLPRYVNYTGAGHPTREATWYGPFVAADGTPIQENIRIAEEAIKQRIEQVNKNS